MTTKQYLNQANSLNRRIKLLQAEIEKLREMSTSISVNLNSDKVQTSSEHDKLANAVAQILEKEESLAATIVLYNDSKEIIKRQIEGLDSTAHIDVLYGRHIVGLSFFNISIMVGKKERQTFNIYNDAMKAFEEKYGHLYK